MKIKTLLIIVAFVFLINKSFAQTSAGNSFYVDYPSWNAGTQPPVYFDCGTNNILNTGNELTMEVWIRLYNSTWNQKILGKVSSAFDNGYVMASQLGQNYSEVWNPGHNEVQAGSSPIDSAWIHFATSFGSGVQMLNYINGELVGGIPLTSSAITASTNPFVIGIAPWDLMNFQTFGQIDEIRIWSVVRTDVEIKSNMHKHLTGSEPGLVAYWDFNQSTGGTLPDLSGNGNTGTINSGAAYWSWSPSYAAVANDRMYNMSDVQAVWYGKDPSLFNYATTTSGLNIIANIQPKAFDYAVYGHNDSVGVSTSYLPIVAPTDFERTSREWYFNKGGNVSADLYFNLSNAAGGGDSLIKNLPVQNYTLLSRDSDNQIFTVVAGATSLLANGTVVKFAGVNLQNMLYCIGVGSTQLASVPLVPEWSKLIQLIPNPTQNSITVSSIQDADLTLLDITGKVIATLKGSSINQKIDVSSFDNGMYILRIVRNGEVASKQFVIQK